MSDAIKAVPDDRSAITPYLIARNAAAAIDFYAKVFGAVEEARLVDPAGKIGHAEVRIGRSYLMLADEYPEHDAVSPESVGGSPVTIHIYVDNVDAVFQRAVDAGAAVLRPVADQFYGDRSGKFKDPFGHLWNVATRKEAVSWDEMQRRAAEIFTAG